VVKDELEIFGRIGHRSKESLFLNLMGEIEKYKNLK
jgi:hypothetical protein